VTFKWSFKRGWRVGYCVYTTLADMYRRHTDEVASVIRDMLLKVWDELQCRINVCRETDELKFCACKIYKEAWRDSSLVCMLHEHYMDNLCVLHSVVCHSKWIHCRVSVVPWLIVTVSLLDDWIYWELYIHTVRDYRQLERYRYSTHFQFTVAHALGFSVFTSRILTTDLSQSHCHVNSHITSSWHSLIPFLQFPAADNSEDATQFSSDYCSVLLQLLNSQFKFCNLVTLVKL
jgi:hypothetical protein